MSNLISIEQIRALFPDCKFEGNLTSKGIMSAASLGEAGPTDASFCQNKKAAAELDSTSAGLVFVPVGIDVKPADGQVFVEMKDPSLGLAKLCEIMEKNLRPKPAPGIHKTACVDPLAKIDESVSIGPMCVIGEGSTIGEASIVEANVTIGRNVTIGKNCYFYPGVYVGDNCVIGDNVRLQPGVVIGGDGFGYIQVGELPDIVHYKVPQIGNVVIGNNVEIGANATIDRARFGSTTIGEGTKIDNLVQIAHNVRVGRRCIICAQSAISGSSKIGDYVVMWGQSALAGHIEVGSFSVVGGQAGVAKNYPAGSKITGSPARPFIEERKAQAALSKLVEMMPRLREIIAKQDDKQLPQAD
jgi:UDP-3-O-[3-hydroxymyristoyl] glucosamine N-acyltransferase